MMKASLYRYRLPLSQPIQFHDQQISVREGLLLKWESSWGEIAPLPGFSKESLAEAEEEALLCLKGLKMGRKLEPQLPSVQFGFDCAQRQWPTKMNAPHSPYILLLGTPDEIIWGWREWLYDYPAKAKLKVARYAMRDEVAMVRELCRMAPKLKLILDANCGWTREEAWTFMSHLNAANIEYIEDPCARLEDIRAVASHTGIPVALDELLSLEPQWEPFPQLKAIVIKPMLIGSLSRSKALIDKAHAAGLKVIISSCYESQLGNRQLAHLASEWAPEQAPGLDTLRFFTTNVLKAESLSVDEQQLELLWQS
jgi:o-succinylbenzoate synthase